ncbi:MAG: Tm-1-like ATP-binding domain-containing protein [Candidatus Hodarchaeota archaeon]
MPKSIAIIGMLDTKGEQIEYLKQRIEGRGHKAIVIDVGVVGGVPFKPTISRERVAVASGLRLQGIIALNDKKAGMEKMAEGACEILKELYARDELDGVVAMGGTMGTALAVVVMKVVPLFVPKLILTTIAYSPVITPDIVGGDDLMMLPWVGGLSGLNSLSRRVLETAAGAISGAAEEFGKKQAVEMRKVVGASGSGFAAFYNQLRPALAERGYELAVFHFTGMNTRILERAITDGLICASLDLYVGPELLDEILGGCYSAGEHRLEAAGKMGIPQIVAAGAIASRWSVNKPVPAEYAGRANPPYNILHSTMTSVPEEYAAVAKLMAEKLNKAIGPTAMIIGMAKAGHVISKGVKGMEVFAETRIKGMEAFREAFMKDIDPKVKVVVLEDGSPSDPRLVNTILTLFDEVMPR